jgi:hypothetical protein
MHALAVIVERNLRATGRLLAHVAFDTGDARIDARHRVAREIVYEGSPSHLAYQDGYQNGFEESLPSYDPVREIARVHQERGM